VRFKSKTTARTIALYIRGRPSSTDEKSTLPGAVISCRHSAAYRNLAIASQLPSYLSSCHSIALLFYGFKKHPQEMGAAEVERYLSNLATKGKVAASTQRQALNAIVFLYREVLDVDLGEIAHIRSKRQRKPPTVLTQGEVQQVLAKMEGAHRLMTQLLYGCGLRLMECIRLLWLRRRTGPGFRLVASRSPSAWEFNPTLCKRSSNIFLWTPFR